MDLIDTLKDIAVPKIFMVSKDGEIVAEHPRFGPVIENQERREAELAGKITDEQWAKFIREDKSSSSLSWFRDTVNEYMSPLMALAIIVAIEKEDYKEAGELLAAVIGAYVRPHIAKEWDL